MAYEKQTWANGDVITAEKLNHIEEGIKNGDNGYEYYEEVEELFNETVTTVATESDDPTAILTYNSGILAQTLRVIFDGEQYEIKGRGEGDIRRYGNRQFIISSNLVSGVNTIYTFDAAGEHTIQAFELYSGIDNISNHFSTAIDEIVRPIIDEIVETKELKKIHLNSVQGNLNLEANDLTHLEISIPSNHTVVGIVGIDPISIQLNKTTYAYLNEVYIGDNKIYLTYGNPTDQIFTRSVYVSYSYVSNGGYE